jgi:hypothetical protein
MAPRGPDLGMIKHPDLPRDIARRWPGVVTERSARRAVLA